MLGKAKDFLGEVKVEVKKVTWPSRKDAMGLVDTLLSKIVEAIISG